MRRLASLMPVVSRLASYLSGPSSLYGQVSSASSCVLRKCSATVSTAIFDATSPEACPPMPSATMASLASSGRKNESSLWARLSPMLVSPLKRTRMLRMGNEELTGRLSGRASSYHITAQKPKLRPDPQGQRATRPRLLDVGVTVDDVLERL